MLSRSYVATALLFFTLIYLGYQSIFAAASLYLRSNHTYTSNHGWPRKIWQKWEIPAQGLEGELQRLSKSWIDYNPGYRYELLTTESSLTFVEDHFHHRPDVIEMFDKTKDGVMRADLIRYLALLAEGGVYSDIDTDCSRRVDDWIPEEYRERSRLVVGVEYDYQGGDIRADFTLPVQLCQWTLMAKPGHPALLNVVDRVMERLKALEVRNVDLSTMRSDEIMDTTGPHVFTKAILESMAKQTRRQISYADISNLTGPRLFGDILILPISAFASGQDHSGSKDWGNDEQLMSHHFLGFAGWKQSHTGNSAPPANEPTTGD